jgi:hypothetical protein
MHEDEHPINSKRWMDVYPAPLIRSDCPLVEITVEELEQEMGRELGTKKIVVVDVRRADCLVSIQLRMGETVMFAHIPTRSQ